MRQIVVVLGFVVALLRPARADVYSDATDIIRALVERNIASEVVPKLASRVPMLCDYFPSSMAALQELRFSGLPHVVHKEVADLVGFKVLLAMRDPNTLTGLSTQAMDNARIKARIEGADRLREPRPQLLVPRCERLSAPADPDDAPSFDGLESIATEALASCVAPQTTTQHEVACAIALLARDATLLDEAGVVRQLQRASIAMVIGALDTIVTADNAVRVSALLGQALRAGKLDIKLVDQLVAEGFLTGSAASAWKLISPLLEAQLDKVSLEGAFSIMGALSAKCTHQACQLLKQLLANDRVLRLIRLLQSRDFGGAAQAAVKILVNVACDKSCTDTDKIVLRFVEKLTVYTVDSIRAGSASSSVSADFRAAATDLIEEFSGPGIIGYAYSKRGFLFPRFALRRASRPGRGSLDVVDYPSIDTLTLRAVYLTEWVYLSPSVTAIDLLGPFTELAVRADALNRKSDWKVFALGFLTPRFELEVGVPAVTNNLTVGAGIALRFYRAVSDGTDLRYCVTNGACPVDDTWNANNVEYSVFVKYVP